MLKFSELKVNDLVRVVSGSLGLPPWRVAFIDEGAALLRKNGAAIARTARELERDWESVQPDLITFITVYDNSAGSCYGTLKDARNGSLMCLREVHEYNITQRTLVKVHLP